MQLAPLPTFLHFFCIDQLDMFPDDAESDRDQ